MSLQYRAAEAALQHGDDSLGPKASGLFDFTLPFEATAFTIGPAAVILLCTPFFLRNAYKASKYMQHGHLLIVKLVCAVALLGCEIANIVLWSVLPIFHTGYTTAASIMSCAGSLCIVIILYAEHMHSYRPSTFLSIFLSITLLFDIVKVRSYFLRDGMVSLAGLAITVLVLKLALVSLEEISKSHLVDKDRLQKPLSRESVSGFWNRAFFLWLNSTLLLGFRKILKVEDLPILGPEFNNEVLHNRFRSHWDMGEWQSSRNFFPLLTTSHSKENVKKHPQHHPATYPILGVCIRGTPKTMLFRVQPHAAISLSSHYFRC
jgi:hypothetical protein